MAPPSAATIRAVYKCLLLEARALQRQPQFALRNALRLEQWGSGRFVEPRTSGAEQKEAAAALASVRSLGQFLTLQERGFARDVAGGVDIAGIIRESFRENAGLQHPQEISDKLDEAIIALQELSEQLLLAKCSSVTTTRGVRIEATSKYVETHSNPEQNVFRFTYRITITNENAHESVQILGRQYTFESEKGQRTALPRNSPGVVGATPVLAPGEAFEYASGVDIDAPRGSVSGCLHALRRSDAPDGDELFDAFVSKFALLTPAAAQKQ
ncbi:hypothetical protein PybrP1_006898 [[Pythium] brassicae (nom. inval.)]|nr:hypothetical protein PybrP1_006898 [[Pythium] brassicae (nom. inval.)]